MKISEKKRVWEVDALRGLLMMGLLITHIMECAEKLCRKAYDVFGAEVGNMLVPHFGLFSWNPELMVWEETFITKFFWFIDYPAVCCFFVVSGISCIFSRNNLKSGIRLMIGAAFVSLFTRLLAAYTGDETQFIRFGALHCYAVCHFIHYFLLENRKDWVLLLATGLSLLIGYYLRYNPILLNSPFLVPFGIAERGVVTRDYWPVFPMLGWFLIGVVMGRHWYIDKKTRFPNLENKKWHRPLRFLGRHSGLIYCGHMVVYSILFIGIGHIFDLY